MSEVVAAAPVAPAAPAPSAPAASAPVVSDDPKTAAQAPAPADGEAKPDPTPAETPESRENKGRDRRKISRLYREAAEAKAERDLLRRQLESIQKPAAAASGAPTLAQFDYDAEKYADAKAEYAKSEALKERDAKQRTESVKQEQERLRAAWEEKVERADSKYEDFDDVVGRIEPGTPFTDAIIEAENAEDVAYYLGKNPTELRRILQLHPRAQVREIGKLEAKLLATPPKPQTPSKAPAPIKALTGTSAPSNDAPSEADDMKTWMRKRNKQVHGR